MAVLELIPLTDPVALRKESVDRNHAKAGKSQSSRVALRKESVDRNCCDAAESRRTLWSLSARRAWIEISYGALEGASEIVALRKESVDRNHVVLVVPSGCWRRSPQGERG